MKLPVQAKVIKVLILFLITAGLIYFIYWLWQRQPKEEAPTPPVRSTQNQIVENREKDITIATTPADGSILDNSDMTLAIKSKAASYTAIFGSTFTQIVKTDSAGLLSQDEKLESGLSLIQISIFSDDFANRIDKTIALYVKGSKTPASVKTVIAGSVKNIFQNVITITATDGTDKKIKQSSSTKITFPSPPPSVKSIKADQNIRVGDYLIILGGETSVDEMTAVSVDVLRDNKPQIQKNIQVVKLLSKVKENLFSGKSVKDNQIIEFTLNKSSQVSKNGQESNSDDIQKDQKAIIIYESNKDQKIVNLIYLLP